MDTKELGGKNIDVTISIKYLMRKVADFQPDSPYGNLLKWRNPLGYGFQLSGSELAAKQRKYSSRRRRPRISLGTVSKQPLVGDWERRRISVWIESIKAWRSHSRAAFRHALGFSSSLSKFLDGENRHEIEPEIIWQIVKPPPRPGFLRLGGGCLLLS